MTATAISLPEGTFDAIIFDCDGTLVDTAALHLLSFQTALRFYGLDMQKDWYMARTGLTPEGLLTAYGREVQPLPAPMTEYLGRVTAAFQENLHTLQEVRIVADVVRQWHGKVPMGVASNGERANVRGSLEAAGLLRFFDKLITIEDVRQGKPAPDVYLEAARQLGVAASRCVVLEDSNEGLRAAAAAGMQGIDVRPWLHA